MLHTAWGDLASASICNCWQKCGLTLDQICAAGNEAQEYADGPEICIFLQPEYDVASNLLACLPSTEEDTVTEVREEIGLANQEEEEEEEEPEPPSIKEAKSTN